MSYGFIILRHARDQIENLMGKQSFESVRKNYPDIKIVIIDDHSPIHEIEYIDENTQVIYSELPPCIGELNAWYYMYKLKLFDNVCVIHDSMGISEPIINFENHKNIFLWKFEGEHMLGNHNEEYYAKNLINGNLNWIHMVEYRKNWKGCFGVCGIFEWEFLVKIQIMFGIFNESYLEKIRTRTNRMAIERIFGWICCYNGCNGSLFDDIHYYPNAFYETPKDKVIEKMDTDIKNKIRPIIKIWCGR